jgi:hypothetical protein
MTAKQRAARAKFKSAVTEAKRLRKKNPSLTQAQALKQAFAISYSKKRVGNKIGNVDKHKDTKSHNVNIRVMSGITKIIGIPHKAKFYTAYKINNTTVLEYFDKLPPDIYTAMGGDVFVYRPAASIKKLFAVRYTKNDKIVNK